eukprot:SAG11_NODE_510_length_8851_cov_25.360718_12_plen_129_part_00
MCEYGFIAEVEAECSMMESSQHWLTAGNCDIDADECASCPCANGATCTESGVESEVSLYSDIEAERSNRVAVSLYSGEAERSNRAAAESKRVDRQHELWGVADGRAHAEERQLSWRSDGWRTCHDQVQ